MLITADSTTFAECKQLAASWAPVLRALANEERLLIVLWLADSECSVRELEQVTGLSQSLVSYHLAELRKAGIVTSTARGRSNRYRLAAADLDQLAALLSRVDAGDEAAEASAG